MATKPLRVASLLLTLSLLAVSQGSSLNNKYNEEDEMVDEYYQPQGPSEYDRPLPRPLPPGSVPNALDSYPFRPQPEGKEDGVYRRLARYPTGYKGGRPRNGFNRVSNSFGGGPNAVGSASDALSSASNAPVSASNAFNNHRFRPQQVSSQVSSSHRYGQQPQRPQVSSSHRYGQQQQRPQAAQVSSSHRYGQQQQRPQAAQVSSSHRYGQQQQRPQAAQVSNSHRYGQQQQRPQVSNSHRYGQQVEVPQEPPKSGFRPQSHSRFPFRKPLTLSQPLAGFGTTTRPAAGPIPG